MPNPDRLKRLVHYVCQVCPDRRQLGTVKLNKIFWYADTSKYRQSRQTISDAVYLKQQRGPVVRDLQIITRALEQEGRIRVHEDRTSGIPSRQYESLIDADVSDIAEEDLQLLKQWTLDICQGYTGPEISDLSHNDATWRAADMGEELPVYAVLAEKGSVPLTEEDRRWAEEVTQALPPVEELAFKEFDRSWEERI